MTRFKALQTLIDDQRLVMKIYACGALLFFVGFAFIIYADRSIAPSLQQEIYMLLGALVGGAGFTTAMTAQLLLIIGRFKNMGQRP